MSSVYVDTPVRPPSNYRSTSPFLDTEPQNDNDKRIKLHMLLSEARRFHAQASRRSGRRPVGNRTAGTVRDCWRPTPSTSPDLMDPRDTSDEAAPAIPPPIDVNGEPCSTMDDDDDADCEYDGWAELQAHIEEAWYAPGAASAFVRYNRIQSYLTNLFIWDTTRQWHEFENASANASRNWIAERQRARLHALAPGELFIAQN